VPVLTSWLTEPADGHGIHLATGDGGWEFISYPELARGARRVGAELAAAGVSPGDVVCMLMSIGLPCLATFFGIWAAGGTPSLVVPPSFQPRREYVPHVAAVLAQARPALVVGGDGYQDLIAEAMAAAGRPDRPWIYRVGPDEITPRPPAGLAVLQFTSGSTSHPRGVRATWDNLSANTSMLRSVLGWRAGDGMASWLPLHHDMGLVGALLTTVGAQGDLWLMQPEQFIRRPFQWLSCMRPGMAAHTMSPGFTFAYLSRRIQPARLTGLDLSQWRTATVGAEVIDPAALASFARLARTTGFSSRVYRPGYGLAEATLAVTVAPGPEAVVVRPDPACLRFGEPVRMTQAAVPIGQLRSAQDGWLIGHGRPAPEYGVVVTIRDDRGVVLPDGYLGEIVVTGPGVTAGYHGGQAGGSTRFVGTELRTGDAGFLDGADLFVLGRMGDSLKVNGASVYVEELDAAVAAATGLDRSRLAAVSDPGPGRAGVALFAEASPDGEWVEAASQTLRRRLGPDVPVAVIAGSRGLIRKTSSGKPRRRHMWQLLQTGQLPRATVVVGPGAGYSRPSSVA
jgi:fatty-acyl-CoA synthase